MGCQRDLGPSLPASICVPSWLPDKALFCTSFLAHISNPDAPGLSAEAPSPSEQPDPLEIVGLPMPAGFGQEPNVGSSKRCPPWRPCGVNKVSLSIDPAKAAVERVEAWHKQYQADGNPRRLQEKQELWDRYFQVYGCAFTSGLTPLHLTEVSHKSVEERASNIRDVCVNLLSLVPLPRQCKAVSFIKKSAGGLQQVGRRSMLLHYGARDLSALAPTAAPAPPQGIDASKDPNYIFGLDFLPSSEAKPPSPSAADLESVGLPKIATPSPTAKSPPAPTKAPPSQTPVPTTSPSKANAQSPASSTTSVKPKAGALAPAPSAGKATAAAANVSSTDMRFGVDFLPDSQKVGAGTGSDGSKQAADDVPLEQVVAPIITKRSDLEVEANGAQLSSGGARPRSRGSSPQAPAPAQQWWEPPRPVGTASAIIASKGNQNISSNPAPDLAPMMEGVVGLDMAASSPWASQPAALDVLPSDHQVLAVPARLVVGRAISANDAELDPALWAQPRFAEDEAQEAAAYKSGLQWLTGSRAAGRDSSSRSVFIPMLLQGVAARLTRT